MEKLRKTMSGLPIPFQETQITDMLRHYKDNHNASQTRTVWKTLSWVARHFGLPDPAEKADLHHIYEHTVERLGTVDARRSRKAIVPQMQAILALETATKHATTAAGRYAAAVFRFQLGCSGRYDDLQHTSTHTLTETTDSVEAKPWQTKTTDIGRTQNCKALVAPKTTFSGIPWWQPLITTGAELSKMQSDGDYLLPQPARNFTSILLRPAHYNVALKWFRQLLQQHGCSTEHAMKLTLHSLRLWMAEMAYQAKLPKDLRQHIGQWAVIQTADTYTRDHREMITHIWQTVQASGLLDSEPPRSEAPRDLPLIDDAPPPDTVDSDSDDKEAPVPPALWQYPKELGGPLTACINKKKTTGRKIHFYTLAGSSACGMLSYNPVTNGPAW